MFSYCRAYTVVQKMIKLFLQKSSAPKLKMGESEESQQDAGAVGSDDEPIIECPKKRRHLKKLEKTLRVSSNKILLLT